MKKITKLLKRHNELIGTIAALTTSVLIIYNNILSVNLQFLKLADILNLLVLIIGFFAIQKQKLEIKEPEFLNLTQVLHLKRKEIEEKKERTNELVHQLVNAIKWFILILSGFYILQLFFDSILVNSVDDIVESIRGKKTIFELLSGETCDPDLEPKSPSCLNFNAAKFLSLEVLINSTNLFSAAFLFTAFQVLFARTLKNDNKTWDLNNQIPFAIAILITVINFVVLITELGYDLNFKSNAIRLFGGLFNGVAMALLFSRFISMEFFFKRASKSFERNFYLYGILVALPLYIAVQPLYGLFYNLNTNIILFKSIVFLVCFWGKLVFLFFVYTMIDKRWVHAYIMVSLTNNKTIEMISEGIDNVDLLKIENQNPISDSTMTE